MRPRAFPDKTPPLLAHPLRALLLGVLVLAALLALSAVPAGATASPPPHARASQTCSFAVTRCTGGIPAPGDASVLGPHAAATAVRSADAAGSGPRTSAVATTRWQVRPGFASTVFRPPRSS